MGCEWMGWEKGSVPGSLLCFQLVYAGCLVVQFFERGLVLLLQHPHLGLEEAQRGLITHLARHDSSHDLVVLKGASCWREWW